jgi:hypothetical protein
MPKSTRTKLADILREKLGPAPQWAHGFFLRTEIREIRLYLEAVTCSFQRLREEERELDIPEEISSYDEAERWCRDNSHMQFCYGNVFPTIAYQTTFLSSYSYLEDRMLMIARLYGQTKGDDSNPEKGKTNGIFAAKERIEKHGLTFPAGHAWDEAVEYSAIRHAIIHCRGNLRHARKAGQIRAYAARNPKVKISPNDHVEFSDDFCAETLDNIQSLLASLYAVVKASF